MTLDELKAIHAAYRDATRRVDTANAVTLCYADDPLIAAKSYREAQKLSTAEEAALDAFLDAAATYFGDASDDDAK